MRHLGAAVLSTLALAASGFGQEDDRRLRILVGTPDGPRLAVTDRQWPARHGQSTLCLWKDDALAALTLTVDDNMSQDHEWWLEQGKKYGLRITWFVITGRVGTGGPWGTWEGFRKLLKAGHDVQSHTVTHLHTEGDWKGIEWEYSESARQIEANLPGHRAVCLAYPGGKNSGLNDPGVAARYYLGCRGTTGSINAADRINYANTHSTGLNIGTAKFPSQDLMTALEKRPDGHARLWRSWVCCHFHGVEKLKTELAGRFAAVRQKAEEGALWVALFREAVQYGQERDTATLSVKEASPARIVLALSDRMEDGLFGFPLTVKTRVDGWAAVKATQDGKPLAAKIIEHEGGRFALVQAIPDRGDVTLTP